MTAICSLDSKIKAMYCEDKWPPKLDTRPKTSPGYWLCCLLPLSFVLSYIRHQALLSTSANLEQKCIGLQSWPYYKTLTVASVGMVLQTVCLFRSFSANLNFWKPILELLPGLITSMLFVFLSEKTLWAAAIWGFGVTIFYQKAYMRVMQGFPKSFSYGEGSVVVQGLTIFLINCVMHMPRVLQNYSEENDFDNSNTIMMSALFFLFLACGLLAYLKPLRSFLGFYILLCLLFTVIACAPVTKPIPIIWIFNFVFSNTNRIVFVVFCLTLVGATVWTVKWQMGNNKKATTSVRKIFHVLVVLVYMTGLLRECTLLYVASGVAFAVLAISELFRLLDVPPLGRVLNRVMGSFIDQKDSGLLAVTPFCLLIGVSLPLWVSPCVCSSKSDKALEVNLIQLMSGVLSVGIGDSAASFIGSNFGRMKWINSSRSLEGTIAYVVSVSFTLFILHLSGHAFLPFLKWLNICVAIFITSLLEAFTDQIDNLVLPLVFYIATSFT